MVDLDTIDMQLLGALQENGRVSHTDLAQRVGLSAPSVMRRVKLLEERGYIRGYTALLDPLLMGLTVTAFVLVETVPVCDLDQVAADIGRMPGVQEVHRLLGEWCFLLKVRTANPQTLEDLIYKDLRRHPGVRRTQTTLSTSASLETTQLTLMSESLGTTTEQRAS